MLTVTKPIDLQGIGEPMALLSQAHGFDRMEFDVTDMGEVGVRRVTERPSERFRVMTRSTVLSKEVHAAQS